MLPDILTSDEPAIELPSISEQSSQPPLPSKQSTDGTICTKSIHF